MMAKQRNCVIDMMRFVCTLLVMLHHLSNYFLEQAHPGIPVQGGNLCVEFFFIVSGFLLAGSAERYQQQPVWQGAWQVMKRKFCGMYPVWMAAWMLALAATAYLKRYSFSQVMESLNQSVSSYLMLTKIGLPDGVCLSFAWYIPVLLLTGAILTPFLVKNRRSFTYTAAPLITLFSYTYHYQTFGTLMAQKREQWLGVTWNSTVRGLGGVCLGIMAYEICRQLKEKYDNRLTKTGRTLFTLAEAAALVYALHKIVFGYQRRAELSVILCLAVFVVIAFTGFSRTADMVKGSVWTRLGQYSLALYLTHGTVQNLVEPLWGHIRVYQYVLLYVGGSMLAAAAVNGLAKLLALLYRKGKAWLARVCLQA